VVRGFFIATLTPLYVVCNKLEAQDVHIYMSDDADKRDFLRILDAFETWANENPKVVMVTLSDSDFIDGLQDRLASIYQKRGFTATNRVFKKRIARNFPQEAR
jgi:hypothetical protein